MQCWPTGSHLDDLAHSNLQSTQQLRQSGCDSWDSCIRHRCRKQMPEIMRCSTRSLAPLHMASKMCCNSSHAHLENERPPALVRAVEDRAVGLQAAGVVGADAGAGDGCLTAALSQITVLHDVDGLHGM